MSSEPSCDFELPGGGRALFTDARARQPVERRRRRARARAPSARAPARALGVRAARARPPGARHAWCAVRVAALARRSGSARRGRRPGDRRCAASARWCSRADCLPVALGARRAPWRCSTPAGAGSPRACSRRACARCASSAARGEIAAIDRSRRRRLLLRGRRRRCTRAFGGAHRDGAATSTCARSPASGCCAAGVAEVRDVARVHDLRRALLLPPARRRARRPPGGGRVAELITRPATRERVAREPRAGARARSPPRAARARRRATAGDGRDAGGDQVRARRGPARARRRPASRSWARTARRISQAKVAAHGELFTWDFIGAAAEPPGARDRAARAPDPLASPRDSALRELERHRELARARAARSWSRSTSPASPARRASRPRSSTRFIARSPVPGRRPDDDAAARRATPRTAAAGSPRCASWPTSTACAQLSMGTSQDYARRGRGGRHDRANRHEAVRLDGSQARRLRGRE